MPPAPPTRSCDGWGSSPPALELDAANRAAAGICVHDGVIFDTSLPARPGLVSVPVLLLWGQEERIVPLASFDAIRNALASARVLGFAIPDAGHRPRQERPAFVGCRMKSVLAAESARLDSSL